MDISSLRAKQARISPRAFLCALLVTALPANAAIISDESPCNPVRVENCVLPYPSDLYSTPDATSPTGRSLLVPSTALRDQVRAELPPTLTPESVFSGSSGFSAATTVLFELDHAPDLTTLPTDGGNAIVALDLDTGERMPVRVLLNEYARSRKVTAPKQVVEIYPRSRWQFGGRYVVGLTKQLKPLAGGEFAPSAGFVSALQGGSGELQQAYAPALAALSQAGVQPSDLISATFFSVRTEDEVTGPMRRVAADVYAGDHPIRDLKINYFFSGHIGAVVRGDVLLSSYRIEDRSVDYGKTQGDEYWTRFRLTIPRASKRGPVPVAIYGHGLGILKESDLVVSLVNAIEGVATVSIDQPNHGSRMSRDGGYAIIKLGTHNVPLQVGMTAQSNIDFIALLKAVKTSMADIDVMPKKLFSPFTGDVIPGRNGDGVPDLDVSNVFYESTSLGGVLGATFVALAPDLKGAFMQVPGVGITSILSGSILWDLAYNRLEPPSVDGAEALLLKAAMQHEM
ncbi:MAG TPA: hypothetical protein VM553_11140, partial [Dongiaceae bacterium]|nr:hypothetical protein [Dongiaceae bacterium]